MRHRGGDTGSLLLGAVVLTLVLGGFTAGCGEDDPAAQQDAIEQARREGALAARQNQRIKELERELREEDGGSDVPASQSATPPSSYVAEYGAYTPSDPAYGYAAEAPVGGGWTSPTESHPTSGQLLRTTWRGPDGTLLIIDRTPNEVPTLGGAYDAAATVSHPGFGQMTKYNFSRSSALPDCNGRPCVDFLINDGAGGGWGVLAGGPSLPVADTIATHVAQSISLGD